MKPCRAIFLRVVATVLIGAAVATARGQTGSAAGTARELSVAYGFKLATAFPPSTPADVQIATVTTAARAISWSPSVPTAGRLRARISSSA